MRVCSKLIMEKDEVALTTDLKNVEHVVFSPEKLNKERIKVRLDIVKLSLGNLKETLL